MASLPIFPSKYVDQIFWNIGIGGERSRDSNSLVPVEEVRRDMGYGWGSYGRVFTIGSAPFDDWEGEI
jgi:hypothetical protein